MIRKGFASDNNSGVHPEIFKAMEAANFGHVTGYGDDSYTLDAIEIFKKEFGEDTEVFLFSTEPVQTLQDSLRQRIVLIR